MSFSCPHFRIDDDHCLRLKTDCVPGRPGCVIRNAVFAVPVEQRIREKEEERRRREHERIWGKLPAADSSDAVGQP